MPKNYVVDACVFAKLILDETDSVQAERFIAHAIHSGSYLYAPSLFSYELIGILKKNNVPQGEIQNFIQSQHNASYLKIMPFDDDLLRLALDMTQQGHAKSGYPHFYDSVYHALAIVEKCDFITADKRHYGKTRDQGHICLLADLEF